MGTGGAVRSSSWLIIADLVVAPDRIRAMSIEIEPAALPSVYVLHDNPEWIPPLREAFDELGVPLVEWVLEAGSVDLSQAPPEGVFWSRLSASSHTRERAHAKDYARAVLR